jgi:hypothetical protein
VPGNGEYRNHTFENGGCTDAEEFSFYSADQQRGGLHGTFSRCETE